MYTEVSRQTRNGGPDLGSPRGLQLFTAVLCQPQDIALNLTVQDGSISYSKESMLEAGTKKSAVSLKDSWELLCDISLTLLAQT